MIADFKKFIMKGNVLDLAVAVVIGAAFGKIVASFVKDIIMPPIGYLLGGVNFKDLAYELVAKTETTDAVVVAYGLFVQALVDFLIIALVIFIIVKQAEKFQKKKEAAPAKAPKQEVLLEEIRDLLKKK